MRYEVRESEQSIGENYVFPFRLYDTIKERYDVNSYRTRSEAQAIADSANNAFAQRRAAAAAMGSSISPAKTASDT